MVQKKQTLAELYQAGIARYNQYLHEDEAEFEDKEEFERYKEECSDEWFDFGLSDLRSDIEVYTTELVDQILEKCVDQNASNTSSKFEVGVSCDAMNIYVQFWNVQTFLFSRADELISKWIEEENLESIGEIDWSWTTYKRGNIELEIAVNW